MTPIEKVVFIRKQMGYTQGEFADKIRSTVNIVKNIERGRTDPDSNFFQAVSDFTEIPLQSIEFGKVTSSSIKFTKDTEKEYKGEIQEKVFSGVVSSTPLVSQEAAAGFGNAHFCIKEEDIQARYVVPDFNGIDFMIRVKGASMYPKYSSGDIVACRILRESRFIQWNKPYVISTKEQGMLCKRLMPSEDKNKLRLVSDNEEYPPFDVPTDEVSGIALIVGVIRLE